MINYLDYYIPEERISVESVFNSLKAETDLAAPFNTSEDGIAFFNHVLGLREVAYAADMEEVEMLKPLLTKFLHSNIVEPSGIDWLILIGDSLNKGFRMKNLAHYIQHIYDLNNMNVVEISGNHCSNIEYALIYAKSMLDAGSANNILLVAVNKMSIPQDRLVGSYAVKGDGAGLIFLKGDTDKGVNILGVHAFTNGLLYEADVNKMNSLVLCKNYTHCLSTFMRKFSIKPEEISHIIIQNANPLLLAQCFSSLGFKFNKIYTENLSAFGHLDCIDFIVNIKSLLKHNLALGTKVISFGTGWAGSNIAILLEINC